MRAARRGFSLLEVILALMLLAGAVVVLLQVSHVALRNASQARDLSRAQLLCESKIAEIVSGITPTSPVDKSSFDTNMNAMAIDSKWVYSIENPTTDEEGLIAVRVTVTQDVPAGQHPVSFSLVRWIADPNAAQPSSSSGNESSPGSNAEAAMVRSTLRRPAYTLLEVLLALALTVVTVTLMGMAIQVNVGVADKSRGEVEEAQLGRALLQRIADDLRNSVPFQPAPGSTAALSSSGSAEGTSSSSGSAGSVSSSSTGSTTTPVSGGIFGDAQGVQIETSRRPRVTQAMLVAAENGSQPAMLSDIRVVSYSLGAPSGNGPAGPTTAGNSSGGLYRSDTDRLQFYAAMQQGQADSSGAATEALAAEVVGLKFTYYDGSSPNDEWDSNQQGKLPSAVRVSVMIRSRVAEKSSRLDLFGGPSAANAKDGPTAVYDMLVDLPNATVPASEIQSLDDSSSSVDSGASGGSSNPNAVTPSGGRPGGGRPGQGGKGQGGKGQGGKGQGGKGQGGKGQGGKGQGGRGQGGRGQGGQGGRAGQGGQGQGGQGQGGRGARGNGGGNGPGQGGQGQGGGQQGGRGGESGASPGSQGGQGGGPGGGRGGGGTRGG